MPFWPCPPVHHTAAALHRWAVWRAARPAWHWVPSAVGCGRVGAVLIPLLAVPSAAPIAPPARPAPMRVSGGLFHVPVVPAFASPGAGYMGEAASYGDEQRGETPAYPATGGSPVGAADGGTPVVPFVAPPFRFVPGLGGVGGGLAPGPGGIVPIRLPSLPPPVDVPEPSTLVLVASALIVVAMCRRAL